MGAYTVDDLKCCGNCKLNSSNFSGDWICIYGHDQGCCAKWEFDGLIKNERI